MTCRPRVCVKQAAGRFRPLPCRPHYLAVVQTTRQVHRPFLSFLQTFFKPDAPPISITFLTLFLHFLIHQTCFLYLSSLPLLHSSSWGKCQVTFVSFVSFIFCYNVNEMLSIHGCCGTVASVWEHLWMVLRFFFWSDLDGLKMVENECKLKVMVRC